ncbi:unnamed protein product [Adineta steineri]|uniref:Uncharacterized protein n=1 Tax=Adineta steineri TaxID=433720 RepID=A0A815RXY0_9BILA|nr:unnamed protein product [Adineta steineri]CAF4038460.1 unnamed protein product [Adineta steineri]
MDAPIRITQALEEKNCLDNSMEYFRSRAELFGTEEAKGDVAAQLLNDAKQLYGKTRANNKHQTALKPADKQMF